MTMKRSLDSPPNNVLEPPETNAQPPKKRKASRGSRCRMPKCEKMAKTGGFCIAHGGARRCRIPGCEKSDQGRRLCKAHGGGSRCRISGCSKSDVGGGLCTFHGGGNRCRIEGCGKSDQGGGLCKSHGGGRRCKHSFCSKSDAGGGFCRKHGGGKRCREPNCYKADVGSGFCTKHGREHFQSIRENAEKPLRSLGLTNAINTTTNTTSQTLHQGVKEEAASLAKQLPASLAANFHGTATGKHYSNPGHLSLNTQLNNLLHPQVPSPSNLITPTALSSNARGFPKPLSPPKHLHRMSALSTLGVSPLDFVRAGTPIPAATGSPWPNTPPVSTGVQFSTAVQQHLLGTTAMSSGQLAPAANTTIQASSKVTTTTTTQALPTINTTTQALPTINTTTQALPTITTTTQALPTLNTTTPGRMGVPPIHHPSATLSASPFVPGTFPSSNQLETITAQQQLLSKLLALNATSGMGGLAPPASAPASSPLGGSLVPTPNTLFPLGVPTTGTSQVDLLQQHTPTALLEKLSSETLAHLLNSFPK